MKNIRPLILILTWILLSEGTMAQDNCCIPGKLKKEILLAQDTSYYQEADFSRINTILFDFNYADSNKTLKSCDVYYNSIEYFFNSNNVNKRALAYTLIGYVQDSTYNARLLERIKLDEGSLAKTWCAIALMTNRTPTSSEALFNLLANNKDNTLPVHVLINMYTKYDTAAVKKTCWNYVDSKIRNEQVIAIQCLATYEYNASLITKLREFVNLWDIESKGWVISALSVQKEGNLKKLLEPYVQYDNLRGVIIRALKKSPTEEDNLYAVELANQ